MKTTRKLRHATHGPWGHSSLHLSLEVLQRGMETLEPPKDHGRVALVVSRRDNGHRDTPERALLCPEKGVPGDAWFRDCPEKLDAQIAIMRADVARLIANGQPLSLFGDNLLVELDLHVDNLPTGSRLRVGGALMEVTPEPHNGCLKFRQRFGSDALGLTAHPRYRDQRLRGIYLKVIEGGEVAVDDAIEVASRG